MTPRLAEPPAGTREASRLGDELDALTDPVLDDETAWTGVEVLGDVGGPEEVSLVEITGCRLKGLRLTARQFDRARFVDTVLDDCELSGVVLAGATLIRTTFNRCRMSGVDLAQVKATDVALIDCRLDNANLRMSAWEHCDLRECDLTDADLGSAVVRSSRVVTCDLTRAELSKADLAGTTLNGSTLDGLRGAEGVRRVTISSDQLVPLALSIMTGLGIVIDDEAG